MNQSVEIWRACGIGFFVCGFAFCIGAMVGKDIGWKQCGRFLRPDLYPRKKQERLHPTKSPDSVG